MAAGDFRLSDVVLDETIGRSTPDVEHERAVAIFDLIEENTFEPVGHSGGPYKLLLSLVDSKLVLSIKTEAGADVARLDRPWAIGTAGAMTVSVSRVARSGRVLRSACQ